MVFSIDVVSRLGVEDAQGAAIYERAQLIWSAPGCDGRGDAR